MLNFTLGESTWLVCGFMLLMFLATGLTQKTQEETVKADKVTFKDTKTLAWINGAFDKV